MSDRIYITPDDDGFEVHLGPAAIKFTDLHVRSRSNWATPHELVGLGGSTLALTDAQMVELLAEYIRFRHSGPLAVDREQVGWAFSCKSNRDLESAAHAAEEPAA